MAQNHAHNHAAEDWNLMEHSTDPRDFRLFIEEHKSGFLVRKAQHKLEDLADEAFAAAGRNKAALERFLKVHFDSTHAEAARALLAEIAAEERKAAAEAAEKVRLAEEQRQREEAARQAEEKRRREEEDARRIHVSAAITVPVGLEKFLPGAGKTEWFKDLDIGPEMVVVPAGEFMMGSQPDEPERENAEGPQHKVTIAKPFAIGRFAVTFDEWDAAQRDKDWQRVAGRAARQPSNERWGRGDRPVIERRLGRRPGLCEVAER